LAKALNSSSVGEYIVPRPAKLLAFGLDALANINICQLLTSERVDGYLLRVELNYILCAANLCSAHPPNSQEGVKCYRCGVGHNTDADGKWHQDHFAEINYRPANPSR